MGGVGFVGQKPDFVTRQPRAGHWPRYQRHLIFPPIIRSFGAISVSRRI